MGHFVVYLILLFTVAYAYLPVVYIHGVLDSHQSFFNFEQAIKNRDPSTQVYTLKVFTRVETVILPLWRQADIATIEIQRLQREHNFTRFHLVGFSQGGMISRALIMLNFIGVETFMTIASPNYGVFGVPDVFGSRRLFQDLIRARGNELFYNPWIQNNVGLANLWHNVNTTSEYLAFNRFLPLIGNEVVHPRSSSFKSNFLKIKRFVVFGSDGDEIIDPWQSQLFGFFDVPMEKQNMYIQDTFGLKTLKYSGRLFVHFEQNVRHLEWIIRDDLILKTLNYLD